MSNKSKKDPNRKHYFDPVRPGEIDDVFPKLVESKAEAHLWRKGQAEDDIEVFEICHYFTSPRRLYIQKKGSLLNKLIPTNLLNQNVFIKIPYEKLNYLTTGVLQKDEQTKEYVINLSDDFFKGQQRSNYRLPTGPYVVVQFKMNDSIYEGLDISAGGVSIKIPICDKGRFPKGAIVENCVMRLNKVHYNIAKAIIAGVWDVKDENGNLVPELKLGIQFIDLPKDLEETLVQHVNSEARGEEIRKKFFNK